MSNEIVKFSNQFNNVALDGNGQRIPVIDPETGVQKVDKRNRKQWKRVTVARTLWAPRPCC